MKRHFLSLCLLLLSATLLHADYQPMLSVGKQWSFVQIIHHDSSIPIDDSYSLYVTSITDTVTRNGLTYFVVNNIVTDSWHIRQVLMREDTLSRQVWLMPDNAAEELLLYSFDVSVGDTLRNIVYSPYENSLLDMSRAAYIVTHIGDVEGRKAIRLHAVIPYRTDYYGLDEEEDPLIPPYETYFTWVEGIGELSAGLPGISVPDGSVGGMYVNITSLLCVRQDDDVLFVTANGEEYGCNLEKRTALENTQSDNLECRCTNGQCLICIPRQECILSVQIYDCHGWQLLSNSYTANTLSINLPSNVYMLIIKTDKQCYSKKIIIP